MRNIVKKVFLLLVLAVFFVIFCGFTLLPADCAGIATGGIFKSLDKGETWSQKVKLSDDMTISSVNVSDAVLDPLNEDILYLGTSGNGIYKSIDAAETWFKIEDRNGFLERRADVYQIILDASNTNMLFACIFQNNKGYLVRSKDGGSSWEEMYSVSESGKAVLSVAFDPYDSSNIYLGTGQGMLLKSSDFGLTWTSLHWFSNIAINKIVINPYNAKVIYISTNTDGIWKSEDGGNNWVSLRDLFTEFSGAEKVSSFVMDARNPNILYSGSMYGILKSVDAGASWTSLNVPFPNKTLLISSIAVDPANSKVIYFGDGSYLYKSIDDGQSWQLIKVPTAKRIKSIEINKENSNIIYLGVHK